MPEAKNKNGRIAMTLTTVVAVMVGLSFAAVPLYDLFCRVTGYGGTTSVADAGTDVHITDQEITVRFDANVSPGIPWEFHPVERTMKIKIGETGLAFYEATNTSDEPVAGAASYNVAPYSAGGYFSKIACFCFELQVLQPGETVEMPVTFYVDPEILLDRETKDVNYITLSYTMHRTDLPETETGSLAVEPEIEVVGLGSDQISVQ
ncbi:cytochrome c oxidase assembly protein [Amaricoccus tamworthensis]|uniref:cytochrome c oxidase assembly protein n=1 Tax=Amaricoccus tamworthensis TaxID=57002 RepID=UPI003C7EC40D